MKVRLSIPVKLCSTLNQREHWAKRWKRTRDERLETLAAWMRSRAVVPKAWRRATVSMERVYYRGRAFDDDNLAGAFKSIRDALAQALKIDDRDSRVRWLPSQKKGSQNVVLVNIEIEEGS